MREVRIEALALALAVAVTFGSVVPSLYVVADDGMMTDLLAGIHKGHPGLFDKWHAVIFDAAALGHFTPVHQAVKVAAYHFAGPERWAQTVITLYLALHAASAILLCVLLLRMSSPRHVSLLAAAAFALHPVFEELLSCALFAYNAPGLFFLLVACLAWCPPEGDAPRLGRLAVGTGLLLLSMGCNPNLIITAPSVMAFMAVRQGIRHTEARRVIGGIIAIIVAVGLTATHRLAVYGTLTTKQSGYTNISPEHNPGQFGRQFLNSVVLLEPSRTVTINAGTRNPSVLPQVNFTVRPWSAAFLLLLALTGGLCALAVVLGRSSMSENGRDVRCPPFLFGIVLMLASAAPYFLFIGYIDLHRYVYPAVAGAAVVVVTTAGHVSDRLFSRRYAPLVTAIVIAPILLVLLRTDREAVKSIARAHRIARALVHQIADDLRNEPQVTHLYVLGYPRVIGRAGVIYPYQWSLRRVVAVTLGRRMRDNDLSLLTDHESGELPFPLPPWAAVYRVMEDGSTVERVPPGRDLTLAGPMARVVWDDHFSSMRLPSTDAIRQALSSPDPQIVSLWIGSLALRPNCDFQYGIAVTLREMTAEQRSEWQRDAAFAGLAVPAVRARAIRALANWPGNIATIVSDALNDAPRSAEIRSAVLQIAPEHRVDRPAVLEQQAATLPFVSTASTAISLEAVSPWRASTPERAVSSLLIVENRGTHPLPGFARITWEWFRPGDAKPVTTGGRPLPATGVGPGTWRRIPCFIPLPAVSGRYDLEISINVSGRRLAGPLRIRNLGIDS